MTSQQILETYIEHYKAHKHAVVPNVSLVPEGDSTLLFVNSGMFPLVAYLSGEEHPMGKRLVNVQRSLRFEDIEEVGDNRHTTAFHMIGNWSLGDYFKQEQLTWIYSFFVEKLHLDPQRLFATVFAGDTNAPKDTESITLLKEIFASYGIEARENERIFACSKEDNWWQRGDAVGELGGPDSEIYYYLGEGSGIGKHPSHHQNEFLEIGNSVFMQYKKNALGGWDELPQKNVDFGGGLERIAMVVQHKKDIFGTDTFEPIISQLEALSGKKYGETEEVTRAMRITADHLRASLLLVMDGINPGNKDQSYVLRRYIRRIVRFARVLNIGSISPSIVPVAISTLQWLYPVLGKEKDHIVEVLREEEEVFQKTIEKAYPVVQKLIDAQLTPAHLENHNDQKAVVSYMSSAVYDAFQSHGYPPEFFFDDIRKKYPGHGIESFLRSVEKEVEKRMDEHKELSRKGAEQKFKGGLADHSNEVIRYHTATHLLHQALRKILGTHVTQYGSNITGERLRFDFSHPQKLSDEELHSVEREINTTISKKLPVQFVILPKDEAIASGALHFFKEKYPEKVKVYYIGASLKAAYSKEFCGGPHVTSLEELTPLTLYKQEAVGKGIRRVYARFNSAT